MKGAKRKGNDYYAEKARPLWTKREKNARARPKFPETPHELVLAYKRLNALNIPDSEYPVARRKIIEAQRAGKVEKILARLEAKYSKKI